VAAIEKNIFIFISVYIEKKIFSRTSSPISVKLGMIYPWLRKIKNCSNTGSGPFQGGDNHRYAKMGGVTLKGCP
jgi:hypothetical protein